MPYGVSGIRRFSRPAAARAWLAAFIADTFSSAAGLGWVPSRVRSVCPTAQVLGEDEDDVAGDVRLVGGGPPGQLEQRQARLRGGQVGVVQQGGELVVAHGRAFGSRGDHAGPPTAI